MRHGPVLGDVSQGGLGAGRPQFGCLAVPETSVLPSADEVASEDDLEKAAERQYLASVGKEKEWLSEEQVRLVGKAWVAVSGLG